MNAERVETAQTEPASEQNTNVIRYAPVASKTCRVTFRDLEGAAHTVEVVADSLYEAAGVALEAFRQAPFIDPNPGPATRLEVEVREPAVKHVVTVAQVRKWAESGSSDPRDGIRKKRLAEALGK